MLLVVLTGNCAVRLAFDPPQRTCIIRAQMGCEWKHVLLCMANSPYPGSMYYMLQMHGRPDFYFRVFCALPFPALLQVNEFPTVEGWFTVEHNFPVFFPFRVTYQHTHSDVKRGLTSFSIVLKYTDILHIYEFSYERQITIPFFPQNSS